MKSILWFLVFPQGNAIIAFGRLVLGEPGCAVGKKKKERVKRRENDGAVNIKIIAQRAYLVSMC